MNYDKAMNMDKVEFGNMPPQAFLLGLLSAFDNRFQASAGAFFRISHGSSSLPLSVSGSAGKHRR